MNFENLISAVQSYYEVQPLSVIAVGVGLLLVTYFKPKFLFKTFVGVGCLVLCSMALTSLSGTLDTGVSDRDAITARK